MSDLTADEQKNVRAAIRFLRIRCGGWEQVAKALRSTKRTLRRATSASIAFRVARFAGVTVDDLLAGRFPPPGACPHCGTLRSPP